MRWQSGVEILQVPWQMSMFLKDRVNQLGWLKQSTVDQLPYQNIYQVVISICTVAGCLIHQGIV